MPDGDRIAEIALSKDQHFRQTIDTNSGRPQSVLLAEIILGLQELLILK